MKVAELAIYIKENNKALKLTCYRANRPSTQIIRTQKTTLIMVGAARLTEGQSFSFSYAPLYQFAQTSKRFSNARCILRILVTEHLEGRPAENSVRQPLQNIPIYLNVLWLNKSLCVILTSSGRRTHQI